MFRHRFKNGHTALCEYIKADLTKAQNITLVYTHGFCSDPFGKKPEAIKQWCEANGAGFFRYELAGHGSDKERFGETTINTYKEQIFEVVGEMIEGDMVLAGASLGGWLSLLAAERFNDKVKGILGLAAAPDFLKTYFEAYFKPEHKQILEKYGSIRFPVNDFTYIISREMLESGKDNLILTADTIPYKGKARLIQGMRDLSLNWRTALEIAAKLEGDDVKVTLIKGAGHRLDRDEDLAEIRRALEDLLL